MLVNIIQNTISSFISAGISVITTNLKMWLGFETSSIDGDKQITPDKSGNNNVGELFTGKAIEFDGSNDYVDISGFTMSGNVSTFAFWINSNDTLGRMIDIDTNRFVISFENNQLSLYDGSWKNFGTISTNVWNRCVIVTNGTSAKCYVNGVQLGVEKTITAINISSATAVIIGASYQHIHTFFDGKMSDFQIYNAAWTTDDIAYDYANPNKLAIDNPSTNLVVTNLKAYWALSEGDGLVAYDSGTNLEEEEVTNGDYTQAGVGNAISQSGGILVNDNNRLKITSDGFNGYSRAVWETNGSQGEVFKIKADVISITGGVRFINISDNVGASLVQGETFETTITLGSAAKQIGFGGLDDTSFELILDNVSVREVTPSDHGGLINGATYVDAQPRIPQLGMQNWSKGSNLFPYSEDFTEWVISPTTSQVVLAPTEAAPYGQGDVYSIIMQASESDAYIRYATNNTTLTSSTHSVWVKQAPTGSATHIRITNNNKSAWNSGTSQKIALTSSWQRLETTDAITGVRYTIIGSADASGAKDPDCIGKALIYGAQLLEGSSAGVYRFTDGAATSNSTVIANPTIPTQDIFGNAVRDRLNSFNLDGSGYAEVADDATLQFGTGAFTMECWVKADYENTGSGYNNIFILGGEISDTNTASISIDSTKFRGIVSDKLLIADSNYTIGDWYHVCVTRNGSGLCTLYIDSEAQADTETTSASITNTSTKLIGRDMLTTRFYKNLISDVRLYDRALSATEIENNYNAGLSAHTN